MYFSLLFFFLFSSLGPHCFLRLACALDEGCVKVAREAELVRATHGSLLMECATQSVHNIKIVCHLADLGG